MSTVSHDKECVQKWNTLVHFILMLPWLHNKKSLWFGVKHQGYLKIPCCTTLFSSKLPYLYSKGWHRQTFQGQGHTTKVKGQVWLTMPCCIILCDKDYYRYLFSNGWYYYNLGIGAGIKTLLHNHIL